MTPVFTLHEISIIKETYPLSDFELFYAKDLNNVDFYFLRLIVLKKGNRGKGIGSKIVGLLQGEKHNLIVAYISSNSNSARKARRFYFKLGFEQKFDEQGFEYFQWKENSKIPDVKIDRLLLN